MRTSARSVALVALALLLPVVLSVAQPAMKVNLKPGDKAPDFKLQASDGKEYQLSQFLGTKAVALCWFPRAGSEGAKIQCAALQAAMASLPTDKVQVFGCSTAPLGVTVAFGQAGKYGFPVLADANSAVARSYGCLRPDGRSERWTFLIDAKGTLLSVNKTATAQTQGTDLIRMLGDAGIVTPAPGVPVVETAPRLVPGASFTIKFPDMPPTLHALMSKTNVPAAMTVFLPRNYDPQRKHPLLIALNGGDGGDASNPSVARALTQEQDFVCVSLPLFKESIDPSAPANTPPALIIRDADGKFAWPLYKRMLDKLEELVPNLDPAHRFLGGFSNGAHMTGELIDQSDGEIARRFSAFFMVEGGGRTQHFDLIKGKPLLLMAGSVASIKRVHEIADTATAAGAQATVHEMPGVGHAFPASQYPVVREWMQGLLAH
ncbi:MAG: redoxin domain-containing protein [Armatimonadia bacterium]